MRTRLLLTVAAATLLAPTIALAQGTTAGGAVGGAIVGGAEDTAAAMTKFRDAIIAGPGAT